MLLKKTISSIPTCHANLSTPSIPLRDLSHSSSTTSLRPINNHPTNGFSRDREGNLHWDRGRTIGVLDIKRVIWLKNCSDCCAHNDEANWEQAKYADLIRMQLRMQRGFAGPDVGEHAYGFRRRTDGRVELGVGIVVRVDEDEMFYKVESRESMQEWILGKDGNGDGDGRRLSV
ncbi:hypothetical protein BDW69DRAFT_184145 [Aspergillus filifer]